jgi:hypothetical protein
MIIASLQTSTHATYRQSSAKVHTLYAAIAYAIILLASDEGNEVYVLYLIFPKTCALVLSLLCIQFMRDVCIIVIIIHIIRSISIYITLLQYYDLITSFSQCRREISYVIAFTPNQHYTVSSITNECMRLRRAKTKASSIL